MKVCRDINYKDFGISEETGWKVSYDWNKSRKIFSIMDICVNIVISITAVIIVNIPPLNAIIKKYKLIDILLCIGIAILIFLFILTPIHEILHILPMSKFRLNNKCYIILGKGTVGAFYGGEVTKKQHCISLITPLLILGLVIGISIIFLAGIFQMCAMLLLLMHIGGNYRDLFMFFYLNKNFSAKTMFFGNRYRTE